jgi:peroxiredoxin
MHLFYRIDRVRWTQLGEGESAQTLARLEKLCAANANPSHPRLVTYANISGKADLAFMLHAAELGQAAQLHRDLESCFAPGVLVPVFSYLSVTELSEYMPTEEESRQMLIQQEKLSPDSEIFKTRMAESNKRRADYEHYRLYPEMPDWEIMAFYPMSKRRLGSDMPAWDANSPDASPNSSPVPSAWTLGNGVSRSWHTNWMR